MLEGGEIGRRLRGDILVGAVAGLVVAIATILLVIWYNTSLVVPRWVSWASGMFVVLTAADAGYRYHVTRARGGIVTWAVMKTMLRIGNGSIVSVGIGVSLGMTLSICAIAVAADVIWQSTVARLVWILSATTECAALCELALPPGVLLLGASREDSNIGVWLAIKRAAWPLRVLTMLDPYVKAPIPSGGSVALHWHVMRTADPAEWIPVVRYLATAAAMIVVDTRQQSEALEMELRWLASRDFGKVLLLVGDDGQRAALDAIAPEVPIQNVGLVVSAERLALTLALWSAGMPLGRWVRRGNG